MYERLFGNCTCMHNIYGIERSCAKTIIINVGFARFTFLSACEHYGNLALYCDKVDYMVWGALIKVRLMYAYLPVHYFVFVVCMYIEF
jgi:hypothetical protein